MNTARRFPHSLCLLACATLVGAKAFAQHAPPIDRTSAEGWRRSIERLEPKTPEGWRAAAMQDVAFVERALLEHSPLGVATSGAPIARALQRAMAVARTRAAQVSTKGGYYHTLSTLSESIGDPHAAVFFSRNWNIGLAIPDTWWAGLRVRATNGVPRVVYAAPADSALWRIGDVIQSCDGLSLDSLVALNVMPFRAPGEADTPESRRASIPQLFLDMDNPFLRRPQQCRRMRRDSTVSDAALTWRVRTDDDLRAIPGTTSASSSTFGVEWAAPDVAWIRVPTFSGDPATSDQIRAIANTLREQSARLRGARKIVFDVRGNGGGSSINGNRLIDALWSKAELRRSGPARERTQVAWRASAGNLEFWRAFTRERDARGAEAKEDAAFGRRVAQGLAKAIAQKQSLWIETSRGINPSVQRGAFRPSLFAATVYLLSDGACASACLDFADRLLAMPGTRVIGADTDGDGLLMDIRTLPMPSGLTSIAVPQKIYLNRRRGHLERYRAEVAYAGPWADVAVKQWVIGLP
jgi:hypothetical protein